MGKLFSRFINKINSGPTVSQVADEMQLVYPEFNIFMGSEKVAKNLESLRRNGITHIVAIGWDLIKHFDGEFNYLLLNNIQDRPEAIIIHVFKEAFEFIDNARKENGRILVHCHKGLSRSASIIIGYVMRQKQESFEKVFNEIRESRSFIMPNIGFQIQLEKFQENNFDIDSEYKLDVVQLVSDKLPHLIQQLTLCEKLIRRDDWDAVDNQLFDLTMHWHQVFMLDREGKLNTNDHNTLHDAIRRLRLIQTDSIQDDVSIRRFDIMFKINS